MLSTAVGLQHWTLGSAQLIPEQGPATLSEAHTPK